MQTMRRFWPLVVAVLTGCAPPMGSERGECYPNGTCDQGLTCRSERCVRFGADGSATDTPTSSDAVVPGDVANDSPTMA